MPSITPLHIISPRCCSMCAASDFCEHCEIAGCFYESSVVREDPLIAFSILVQPKSLQPYSKLSSPLLIFFASSPHARLSHPMFQTFFRPKTLPDEYNRILNSLLIPAQLLRPTVLRQEQFEIFVSKRWRFPVFIFVLKCAYRRLESL